jgi:hypothetical protein
MNAMLWHPGRQGTADAVSDGPARTAVPPGRAFCCPVTAVVRVIMPPTPARPHETELLLCGHHYRVSRQALATAHATVRPVTGTWDGAPDALLPGLPGPRMPAGQDQADAP